MFALVCVVFVTWLGGDGEEEREGGGGGGSARDQNEAIPGVYFRQYLPTSNLVYMINS